MDATSWMLAVCLLAQERPGLFFREDWKETPPETPVTQAHVANPDLLLSVHGPGKSGIRKSHHDTPADDPYYLWMGACPANCAVSLRNKSAVVDLTGQAKIRWRTKQTGFHELRIILKLADGSWLIGDRSDGPSGGLAGAGVQRLRYSLASAGYCESGRRRLGRSAKSGERFRDRL